MDWLGRAVVLPYDERVAWKWGQLSVQAERPGRARPINDSWIAACCLVADLPLATLNLKDFEDFAEHDGLHLSPVLPAGAGSLARARSSGKGLRLRSKRRKAAGRSALLMIFARRQNARREEDGPAALAGAPRG